MDHTQARTLLAAERARLQRLLQAETGQPQAAELGDDVDDAARRNAPPPGRQADPGSRPGRRTRLARHPNAHTQLDPVLPAPADRRKAAVMTQPTPPWSWRRPLDDAAVGSATQRVLRRRVGYPWCMKASRSAATRSGRSQLGL
jgi:hypothetical protein